MLTELIILTLTLYGECRGESWGGKLAVASVIQNRMMERGLSLEQTCLQPRQFSCWRDDGKQLLAQYKSGECQKNLAWKDCMKAAKMLLAGTLPKTQFDHYYNPKLCAPKWATELKDRTQIGNHIFGKL